MGEGLKRPYTLRFGKERIRVCWGEFGTRNARDRWGLPNVKANRNSITRIVSEDLSIIENYLSIWTKKSETKEHHNPKAQLYMEFQISYA
jgi:hypothetical protein